MSRWMVVLAFFSVLISCSGAHGGGGGGAVCTEGNTTSCTCSGGATGTQTCGADGNYGVCVCEQDAATDAAMDATLDAFLDAPGVDLPAIDRPVPRDVTPDLAPDLTRPDISTCTADTQRDPNNCGACGVRCATGQTCASGRCVTAMSMCPSSCSAHTDCNPCLTPGEMGNFCCISNMCLFMTGACSMPTGDSSTTGTDATADLGALE